MAKTVFWYLAINFQAIDTTQFGYKRGILLINHVRLKNMESNVSSVHAIRIASLSKNYKEELIYVYLKSFLKIC